MSTNEEKQAALAAYLEIDADDLSEELYDLYGLSVFSDGAEYAIGTDDDADEAVTEAIKQSLCYFNASWISEHLDPVLPVEAIKAIQEGYESSNETLLELIEKLGDFEDFVQDSIDTDGRGHFLSGYDGEEIETEYNDVMYYIYRL